MKVYRAIFAATVVAFNMTNFPELFGRYGFYARYGCLLVLIPATLVYATRKRVNVPPGILAAFYIFATYAFLTTFWTENVTLSVAKWVAYVAVSLSLLVGGVVVPRLEDENPFWLFKWIFVPIVLINMAALLRGAGWLNGNFRGYSGNSNALGATIMLTSPWLVYEVHRNWHRSRYRLALLALSGAAGIVLLLTYSRAAIGGMFIIVTFAGWSLKLGRKFVAAYLLSALLLGTYLVRPSTFNVVYQMFVEKRADTVLKSRGDQLQDSWEAAKQGGAFGVGFGVSVGQSRYWDMGTFSEFSREKGNSMLAVIEETGVVGFFFYLGMLYSIWGSLRQLSRTDNPDDKFIYMLGLGFFFGSLFHSAFEAWFLSSGPDVAVYWSMNGLLMGTLILRTRHTNERLHRVETATGSRVFVPSSFPQG